MEEINDFLHLSKPFRRITLLTGVNNGRVVARDFCDRKKERRPIQGTEYAKEFVREQRKKNFEVKKCDFDIVF